MTLPRLFSVHAHAHARATVILLRGKEGRYQDLHTGTNVFFLGRKCSYAYLTTRVVILGHPTLVRSRRVVGLVLHGT